MKSDTDGVFGVGPALSRTDESSHLRRTESCPNDQEGRGEILAEHGHHGRIGLS